MFTQSRIDRGIALLDKVSPDWHWRINLTKLDLASNDGCVLGQLYGGFHKASDVFGRRWRLYTHGFAPLSCVVLVGLCPPSMCKVLTDAWKKAIVKKRLDDETRTYLEEISHVDEAAGVL